MQQCNIYNSIRLNTHSRQMQSTIQSMLQEQNTNAHERRPASHGRFVTTGGSGVSGSDGDDDDDDTSIQLCISHAPLGPLDPAAVQQLPAACARRLGNRHAVLETDAPYWKRNQTFWKFCSNFNLLALPLDCFKMKLWHLCFWRG